MMPTFDPKNPNLMDHILGGSEPSFSKLLINATQHPQGSQAEAWARLGIGFQGEDFTPYGPFNPKHDTRAQVRDAWRNLLNQLDDVLLHDMPVDGFLLGGYAPAVLGLYQLLSQFRHRSYVAVMGPAPLVDGQRRAFVLSGCRLIPMPRSLKNAVQREGQPILEKFEDGDLVLPSSLPNMRHDRLLHVSARPLTEERAAEINTVAPQRLIGSAPALPPPPDGDMVGFERAVEDLARVVVEERCGVLLDGPPAETMLRLYALVGNLVPFYYLKTEVVPGQKLPTIIALDKIPRF